MKIFIVLVAFVIFILSEALFYVDERENKIVLRFGKPKEVYIADPGLKIKIPFVDNVISIDRRIKSVTINSQEIIASDQKRLVVDVYMLYVIDDPLLFFQRTLGNQVKERNLLSNYSNSSVRRILGNSLFLDIVRDRREEIIEIIKTDLDLVVEEMGVRILDVQLKRPVLPEQNSLAVYKRMQTEREQEASQIRAIGEEESKRIRARADREAVVIIAEANRKAAVLGGEGEKERIKVLANAYGVDIDFFTFWRTMQAYEKLAEKNKEEKANSRFVVTPDSDFFKYLNEVGISP